MLRIIIGILYLIATDIDTSIGVRLEIVEIGEEFVIKASFLSLFNIGFITARAQSFHILPPSDISGCIFASREAAQNKLEIYKTVIQ